MYSYLSRAGAFGAIAALATLVQSYPVLALSEDQVIEKLNTVPVFTIVDQKGNPLIVTVRDKDKKDSSILPLFMDQKSVSDAYGNLQKDKKAVKDSQIGVLPLGQAFKVIREEQKKKDAKIGFQFLTDPKTISYALDLFKKNDAKATSFPGIPVFYAMGSDEKSKAKGFVTFEKDGKQYVPLYFDQADIERNLIELKRSKPELAKQMVVEVAPLDSVINSMLEGKNDDQLKSLTFIPSLTSIQYVQTLQKSPNAAKTPPTVAPGPSTPATAKTAPTVAPTPAPVTAPSPPVAPTSAPATAPTQAPPPKP